MIKVTLHHAHPSRISAFNVLGRLDIGYAKIDAHADYKSAMFSSGIGEFPLIELKGYPRWSSSTWDLIVRVASIGTSQQETLPPFDAGGRGCGAFIENLTVHVERWPDGVQTQRSYLGMAHVKMTSRRCEYTARFEEDILPPLESKPFKHSPKVLNVWNLVGRAYAWAVGESFVLPTRPNLYVPIPLAQGGASYVALDTVREPARTGIRRWLVKRNLPTVACELVSGPCVTEDQFVEFLKEAV